MQVVYDDCLQDELEECEALDDNCKKMNSTKVQNPQRSLPVQHLKALHHYDY